MREIKFRVWNSRDKKWDAPSLLAVFNADGILGHLNDSKSEHTIIQQYTGLKDRNGVEIYEGDILKWGMTHDLENAFPRLRFVEFCERQLIYKVVEVGDLPAHVDYLYEAKQASTRWCEVVGNIFENPELIES